MSDRIETVHEYGLSAGGANGATGSTHWLISTDSAGNVTRRPVALADVPEGTPRTATVTQEGLVQVATAPTAVTRANYKARGF